MASVEIAEHKQAVTSDEHTVRAVGVMLRNLLKQLPPFETHDAYDFMKNVRENINEIADACKEYKGAKL